MHTFDSLTADLAAAGFRHDDTVIVHSSMKSIGPVAGGAETVLDVFIDYFGRTGLIVFPSLSHNAVNAEHPRFDVRTTPTSVGILPTLFLRRPGVIRSLHPTHSLAAYGPDAAAFTAGHERFDSPCDRRSPWGRLYDRHGKILFLGVSIRCNTFLHGVEERLPVPGMLTESHQPLEVVDAEGRVIPVPSRRHVGGHSRFYNKLEKEYREGGAMRDGRFGDAPCVIGDCRKIAEITLAALKTDPFLFTAEGR